MRFKQTKTDFQRGRLSLGGLFSKVNNTMTSKHRFYPSLIPFFALFTVLACQDTQPKITERIERYGNGTVSRRVQIVDGRREGKMTDYYPDGKIMAERWLQNGLQEGKTLIYYPSGKVKEVQYYRAGRQQEGDTIWYEDGRIQFTVFMKDNLKDGYLRKWSPDGKLIFESRYTADSLTEVNGKPVSRAVTQASPAGDTLATRKTQ